MRERVGIVLTAGSDIKRAPVYSNPYIDDDGERIYPWSYRLEPDIEGKMRSIAAIDDLVTGKISKIYIAGGAPNYGKPLANIYFEYLNRFVKRYNLRSDQIVEVFGGINTLSDLSETKATLERKKFTGDLVLYSSGYHLDRNSSQNFAREYKKGEVSFVHAEARIKNRHRLYGEAGRRLKLGPIGERVLTPMFLEQMYARNRKVDLVNKLHGTWLVQMLAYIARSQANLTDAIKLDGRTLKDHWMEKHQPEQKVG